MSDYSKSRQDDVANVRQIKLAISGISCRHCIRDVTARLRDVPGVRTVLADRTTGVVVVSGQMAEAEILAALEAGSYRAVVLPAPTETCS